MKHFCKDCGRGFWRPVGPSDSIFFCPHFNSQVNPEKDTCNHFTFQKEFPQCSLCGATIRTAAITYLEGEYPVCEACAADSYACHVCKHGVECGVQYDTSNRPKVVRHQVKQPNSPIIMMTEIINPELIKEYCITCKCQTKDNLCWKHNYSDMACENFSLVCAP